MISAKKMYQYTLISEASYALMGLNIGAISGSKLAGYLQDPSGLDWSAELANEFTENWSVLSHQPNMASGFSAIVYERLEDGNPTEEFVFPPRVSESANLGVTRGSAKAAAAILLSCVATPMVSQQLEQRIFSRCVMAFGAGRLVSDLRCNGYGRFATAIARDMHLHCCAKAIKARYAHLESRRVLKTMVDQIEGAAS